ncbi:MAG: diguanylate cyclase [Epsilonproteobacteria bacterium]|nr:diguanylate cyclase [Campylobacterota bacterium]OIO15828.1 MAG: hypothetical protein AUJ81_06265 [Helicobacteraceae bacterium CG1_02_36_14]PIP09861.1 MAG: hypothetical protein COX50_09160 [Sulfurimonas sp. CG23_combo_of_CG06-09_8_20_14_all_36_33]PIS24077.1 MAG: hypothetical protein COT46_11100 [Sulfurimonas sp. CG08_land_8_20_14_0_20_36_33]PIU35561.1 MAG: hypothetical protein COT05_03240 [Sulfurimonas sp. CG07_land_8_20_14_0_80_36_56]PIV05482.1 MAG: hypothetical protein COS56_01550 [Sulfuri
MNKIVFAFLVNFIFLILLGFVSIDKIAVLSELNNKLYEHPYAVSNASKIIQANIVSMHSYMKDIASAQSSDEIRIAKELIEAKQKIIFEQFDIIFQKYLGDQKDIQKSYVTFVHWEPIRDEVISLMQNGKQKEAFRITKGKGAKYIAELELQINTLVLFADNVAASVHEQTLEAEAKAKKTILLLLVSILLMALSIFTFLVRNILTRDKKIQEYLHVIDENIMNVIVDSHFKIIDASTALARYMKLSKEELLQTQEYFLLSECTPKERSEIRNIMKQGNCWRGEIKKVVNAQTKWLEFSLHPDGLNKAQYTNILHDITDKKEFEKLSKTDALTNLYNRGYFEKMFPIMIKNSQRHNTILCFVMMDIDFFKEYNDTYGHQKGDEALKQVANALRAHIHRPNDSTFRLGGEEFGIIFNIKREEDASPFMEKLLKNIEDLHIEHSGNKASSFLTISMGMCIIKESDTSSVDAFYRKADELLYKAKQNGRNNIQM